MAKAAKGDTVKIEYEGRLEDGTVFDSSEKRGPLSFKLGEGQVIPGFENAVEGMEEGEKKTETVESDEAYGPRLDQLTFSVPRENLPEGHEPKVGEVLRMEYRDGRKLDVLVTEADEGFVKMDGNHPLAGEDLTFDLELLEVEESEE